MVKRATESNLHCQLENRWSRADETDVVALAGLQLTVEADREGARSGPVPILHRPSARSRCCGLQLAKHGATERRQGVPHRAPFAACLDEVRVA
jgi:hypothetical protein